MPKIDMSIKRLFQQRPADWARYVQPDCREEWIRGFQTDYTPKQESRLDSVLEIDDPDGTYLLHFEPMGYRDMALPARMLRYRSDIWEATLTKGRGTPSIRQAVIFFYEDDDNGVHRLYDSWESGRLEYAYAVIRIWEERRQSVIDAKLVGLYPLLPLMKGRSKKETPEQALKESIAVVQAVEDESLRRDLFAAMAALAEGKFSWDLILSLIGREVLMESQIFQELFKDELAAGIKEGEMKKALETARAALKEGIPEEKVAKITGLDQETVLKLKADLN